MRRAHLPVLPRVISENLSRQGGTLFLTRSRHARDDEAKLLRVLEQKEIERVGGDRTIPVDVRVVVATHRNLDELVKTGAFRRILPRIFVFPIVLPPLRERREDIPLLTDFLANSVAQQNDWRPLQSPKTPMLNYGNIHGLATSANYAT